ncbi:MAG TPA: enoyl-CoA hydratase-related protein [Dermatophilaceae bacterium]|jgi:enoyl-CoA hydratase/carnithine racemase|nr:enoyl-CoA hydratase/isomerase family protein [Actinomycetales bacterium]HMT32095.1 enoyl-CoA hydratase-related protein [Dermatophilaceae bacterium]HMT88450.1 enoyl-CoA hydratase-related protein [Dermatophilaceae bacterium]
MGEFVRLEVADGIGTIRLDRPKMNAINLQVQTEIKAAAEEAGERSDIAAVIVYGGERVFAAGADIKEMREMSYTDMAGAVDTLHAYVSTLARLPKPTVAAVTGYALGGGCELAMACDFRFVGASAQMGQPEILLGVIPGMGGTQRLARLVGPTKAKELCFTGRFVKADEALAIGLADRVVPDDQVYAAAVEFCRQFVGGPAVALRATKEAIDRGIETDLESGLALERTLFAAMFATKDRAIGMESFVANGPGKAVFEGR